MPIALLLALFATAAPRPFHLQLESNAAATFPMLQRFGVSTIDVYPAGFRAKTIWLRGYSRNGSKTMTVENPLSRTYVDMPLSDIGDMVRTLGGHRFNDAGPARIEVANGTVKGVASRRFRLIYAPDQFVDVWTTTALGDTPQLRAVINEFVISLAPVTAKALRTIPGTPIYVELNTSSHRKVVVLRPKSLVYNRSGEVQALRVSPFMFPAPFGTIFK